MPTVLDNPLVCAALGTNAAVWSGWSVVLLKSKQWPLFGVAAMLAAAGFEVMAYVTLAPHIMGALGGLSMLVAVWIGERIIRTNVWVAIVLVSLGAIVGLVTVQPRQTRAYRQFLLIYGMLLVAALCVTGPTMWRLWVRPGSKARLLLPCSEAFVSLSGTTLIAYLGSGGSLWAMFGLFLSGALVALNIWVSLKFNSVREHVVIAYSVWSTGLVLLDAAGHYTINAQAVVIQFVTIGVGIVFLLVPTKST